MISLYCHFWNFSWDNPRLPWQPLSSAWTYVSAHCDTGGVWSHDPLHHSVWKMPWIHITQIGWIENPSDNTKCGQNVYWSDFVLFGVSLWHHFLAFDSLSLGFKQNNLKGKYFIIIFLIKAAFFCCGSESLMGSDAVSPQAVFLIQLSRTWLETFM